MNKYWFKPKKYGYGATPSTMEGWIVTIVFIILFISIASYSKNHLELIISIVILTGILLYISKTRTNGKWKWRWGD